MIKFLLLVLIAASMVALRGSAQAQVSFADAAGLYSGLALPTNDQNAASAGILHWNMTPRGAVSGSINIAGIRSSFRDVFDPTTGALERINLIGITNFPDGSREPYYQRVTAQLNVANLEITGAIAQGELDNFIVHSTFTLSGAPPDPTISDALAGKRQTSFIDSPDPSASGGQEIPGDGFAVVNIARTKRRSARLAGKLPDAATYSVGTPLKGTRYFVYNTLYGVTRRFRTGSFTFIETDFRGTTYGIGNVIPLASPSPLESEGQRTPGTRSVIPRGSGVPGLVAALRWVKKPEIDGDFFYRAGIRGDVNIDARHYPGPTLEGLVPIGLDQTRRENAIIKLQRGNLDAPIEAAITMRLTGATFERMLSPTDGSSRNPYRLKVHFNALIGTFHGSFVHPGSSKTTRFSGAFRPKVGTTPGQGRGAFRGSLSQEQLDAGKLLESGSVRISVNP